MRASCAVQRSWPYHVTPVLHPGIAVLDLCCGVAGPGPLIPAELGCSYPGVDLSSSAIDIARELPCRFEVLRIPPVPSRQFNVVLPFKTMLAFPDTETLLQEVSGALAAGGRFAFTLEEGLPLTEAERGRMPHSDTVWLTPLPEMLAYLIEAAVCPTHFSSYATAGCSWMQQPAAP
jgi:SAM-dependent methyltransferase